MSDEEFQKLSEEEKNAQWDRELDSMTPEDVDRSYFNCTGRKLGDPIPPDELVHQVSDWCSVVAIKMGRRQGGPSRTGARRSISGSIPD